MSRFIVLLSMLFSPLFLLASYPSATISNDEFFSSTSDEGFFPNMKISLKPICYNIFDLSTCSFHPGLLISYDYCERNISRDNPLAPLGTNLIRIYCPYVREGFSFDDLSKQSSFYISFDNCEVKNFQMNKIKHPVTREYVYTSVNLTINVLRNNRGRMLINGLSARIKDGSSLVINYRDMEYIPGAIFN